MLAMNYGGLLGNQKSSDIATAIITELVKALKNGEADIVF